MCKCPYCLQDECRGDCVVSPSGYSEPWMMTVTGTFDDARGNMSSCECPMCVTPDVVPSCAGCPAKEYLTIARVMAAEIEALQAELDACKDTLQCVLDHVKWDSIPECLVDDIDAIFDGNVDDEDESE